MKKFLVRVLAVPVGFLVGFVLMSMFGPMVMRVEAPPALPTPQSPVERVMEKHADDCWSGAAPEGAIPGHVIVTYKGETGFRGERMVGIALDHVFTEPVKGLTVHAFCY